jgi:hypothetical protein
MVKFINRLTGNEMWVDESRVDEYKAAGHKLAASITTTSNTARKKSTKVKK